MDENLGVDPAEGKAQTTIAELSNREPLTVRVIQVIPKETWAITPLIYGEEKRDG